MLRHKMIMYTPNIRIYFCVKLNHRLILIERFIKSKSPPSQTSTLNFVTLPFTFYGLKTL